MPNDPIREKFEQWAIDIDIGFRDDEGFWLYGLINRHVEMAYRAGRASVIAEMKPHAYLVPDLGVYISRSVAEAESHTRLLLGAAKPVALAIIPKE